MDKFEIPCPGCQRQVRLAESQRETQVRCPTCKTVFIVRAAKPVSEPAARKSAPPVPRQRKPAATDTPSRKSAKDTSKKSSPARMASAKNRREARRAARRKAQPQSDDYDNAYEEAGHYAPQPETYDDEGPHEDDVEDYDDPFGGTADYGYDTALPSPTRSKTSRKSRSSGNAGQIIAIAVAICVAVGAVGGLGYVAWRFIPGLGGNVVDLSYMPENIQGFARVNVADVASSALFRDRIAGNPAFEQSISELRDRTGMALSDIDSITVGMSSGGMGSNPFSGFSGRSGNGMMVIRTRSTIPTSPLTEASQSETSSDVHNGATLYSLGGSTAWLPDFTTLVIGPRSDVESAIDRDGKQHRFRQFDFASTGYDILIVGGAEMIQSGFNSPLSSSFRKDAKGVAFGIDLSSGADVMFQVNCQSRAQARASVEKTETERADAKRKFDQQAGGNPFLDQEMASSVKGLIDDVSISSSGSVLTMKVMIGKDLIDRFFNMLPGF